MKVKQRLDFVVAQQYPHLSRNYIQSLIMQGKVKVNNQVITKSGTLIDPELALHVDFQEQKYVSRAGYKLEAALDHFGITVENLVALDAGISTGGFTDCLLQRGIKTVYGIDVGYGQVHEKIRNNPQVILYERTNLRLLEHLPELVDIITLDLSFISVLKVMPVVTSLLKNSGKLIVLIKPQFETEKHKVGKGGIVSDPKTHEEVIKNVTEGIVSFGFQLIGVIPSPITGTEGNKEFLAYFIKNN